MAASPSLPRYQSHLLRLRKLGLKDGPEPTPEIAAEVRETTAAIIAEAQLAVGAGSGDEDGPSPKAHKSEAKSLMRARLHQLTVKADEAVAAAARGDRSEFRRELRRLDELATALFTKMSAKLSKAGGAK